MYSSQHEISYRNEYHQSWIKFFTWGVVLILLGILAISIATISTLISIIILGFFLLFGGIIILLDAFTFWRKKKGSFFLILSLGILYSIVGFILIKNPILSSISLTLFLGLFYLFIGIFRMVNALFISIPNWGWGLVSGGLSAILGVLILANWPQVSLYIIGLFIGIDLIFMGCSYLMIALGARSLVK